MSSPGLRAGLTIGAVALLLAACGSGSTSEPMTSTSDGAQRLEAAGYTCPSGGGDYPDSIQFNDVSLSCGAWNIAFYAPEERQTKVDCSAPDSLAIYGPDWVVTRGSDTFGDAADILGATVGTAADLCF